MPIDDQTPVVTLKEGNTPLVEAPQIAERLGPEIKVYLKCEGANPTGSFKDRGMTLAISKASGQGARTVICASTGNTAASAAAYAARAGLKAFVLIPKGSVALGKLSQSVMHGARVLEVVGNFDICLKVVRDLAERDPVRIRLVNSVNPDRIAGQKTAAFEICDQLGDAPSHHFLPVGNAGNITAYWAGYQEYQTVGLATRVPKMMGYQAAESAPIVLGHPIDDPHTVATAIKIGNPASWKGAERARDDSGGVIDMVTDAEILAAYRMLALGGVFAEPASAASVAGLMKFGAAGGIRPGSTCVCTLTGHGLKDPDTALKNLSNTIVVEPDITKVLKILDND
ncbi:MAG: threonine synthase [Deltaproteobacteria bacterium]|nr:threonine synthase [Deltaproteobacteria bacterium]